jgi:hypothetical protein
MVSRWCPTLVGERFEVEVRAALIRTVELPESAPVYAGEFRQLLVRKFDHGIFYRIHGARIVVRACPKESFRNKFMSCAVAQCSSDSLVAPIGQRW